jgi:hypothetical protein
VKKRGQIEALTMLETRWYTWDSERLCLVEHADRFSALKHAEAVIRANPKQLVRILVLDGIVSMPSSSASADHLSHWAMSLAG